MIGNFTNLFTTFRNLSRAVLIGIFKANKVQSPTSSDFINFEDCF